MLENSSHFIDEVKVLFSVNISMLLLQLFHYVRLYHLDVQYFIVILHQIQCEAHKILSLVIHLYKNSIYLFQCCYASRSIFLLCFHINGIDNQCSRMLHNGRKCPISNLVQQCCSIALNIVYTVANFTPNEPVSVFSLYC